MNTIIDLNVAANVTYNNEASYAISFGTNLGNTTANIDAYSTANITKQTSLNSITDAVRDLLIDVQFSNVGNVSMAYVGTYSNIGLLQIAPAAWRVNGIRSVPQYNEAFANVKYSDLTGAGAITPEYSYITTVNDQSGNTRTWTTTVDINSNPVVLITGNLVYNEDTITNVTVANIAVDPTSLAVFRLYANTVPTYGSMTDGVTVGNSIFIDGNATSLNSQITAGGIKFWPASDFTSNVANAINFSVGNTTTTFSTANANIQIGNTHNEYSLTTSYGYAEDSTVQMVFDITDLDSHPDISYVSTFTQTSGPTSQFYVNGVAQGYGNAAVLANTKANINVANVSFLPYPDSTANVGLTYTQVKVQPTGNTTQASNVAISLTNTSSHDEYSFASGTYSEDTRISFGNTITDTDTRAQSYTISLLQTAGNIGQFYRSNVLVGNANTTLTISNSKANINNTVSWQPPIDYTGNVTFTYNQSKLDVFGNTIVQASNVTATYTNANTNPEISNMIARTITANAVANIFATTTPYINDGPDYGQTYTITLSSPVGQFGNSAANAIAANTYSYSGNMTQVNSEFTNMKFVNNFGLGAQTSSFTYTQSRNGVAQVNTSPVLTVDADPFVPNMVPLSATGQTYTPTEDQLLFRTYNIICVGGGGGGARRNDLYDPTPGGGGGGGAGGIHVNNFSRATGNQLSSGTLVAVVGAGAPYANSGDPSSVTLNGNVILSAPGGERGDRVNGGKGGNSWYNGTVILGGNGIVVENTPTSFIAFGGGGASPTGAGQNASGSGGGNGGPGYTTVSGNIGGGGGGGRTPTSAGTLSAGGSPGGGAGNGQPGSSFGAGSGGGGSPGGSTRYASNGVIFIEIS